jgi:hypothetical protein
MGHLAIIINAAKMAEEAGVANLFDLTAGKFQMIIRGNKAYSNIQVSNFNKTKIST